MAWRDSGDERGKRYRVYQELAERYESIQAEVIALKEELRRKDVTIKHLAAELAAQAVEDMPETSVPVEEKELGPGISKVRSAPPPKQSGTMAVADLLEALQRAAKAGESGQ